MKTHRVLTTAGLCVLVIVSLVLFPFVQSQVGDADVTRHKNMQSFQLGSSNADVTRFRNLSPVPKPGDADITRFRNSQTQTLEPNNADTTRYRNQQCPLLEPDDADITRTRNLQSFEMTDALSVLAYPYEAVTCHNWPLAFEGTVVDQDGVGLGNISVNVDTPITEWSDTVVTDEDGYFLYQINATQTGSYTFSFSFGNQVEQRKAWIFTSVPDLDRLANMWKDFTTNGKYLPKNETTGEIIGWANYTGNDDRPWVGDATTEGQGYSMLRAVWMNDKQIFDALRKWTDDHMWVNDQQHLGWWFDPEIGEHRGTSSAPDGDEDIALASVLAYYKWQDHRDKDFALRVLSSFQEEDVVNVGGKDYVSFGSNRAKAIDTDDYVIDPSYMAPYAYRIFAGFDSENEEFWNGLVDTSYAAISQIQDQCHGGLVSDYGKIHYEVGSLQIVPISENQVHEEGLDFPCYGYDAFRTMWRVAMDVYYNSEPRGSGFLAEAAVFFYDEMTKPEEKIYDQYNATDGTHVDGSDKSVTTYGGNIGATMVCWTDESVRLVRDKILDELRDFADDPVRQSEAGLYQHSWVWFGIGIYQGATSLIPSRIDVSLHSPADLLVTDPPGRRAGIDPTTGQVVNDIPWTNVSIGIGQNITIFNPIRDFYDIGLKGTANGTYSLSATFSVNSTSWVILTRTGNITEGTSEEIPVDARVDTTPPETTIFSPQNKTYYSNQVPLTFEMNEFTSWIGYSLDIQENVTIGGGTILNVTDGTHQIIFYANDTWGNMGSSEIVYFTVNSSLFDHWKTAFIGLGSHPIVGFAVYNENLYAASYATLYRYDGNSWSIIDAPAFMLSLEPYKNMLVVGGEGGLYLFNGTDFTLVFTVSTYIKPLGVYNNTLYAGTVLDNPPALYYCTGSPENPDNWHVDASFSSLLNFSGPFGSIDSFTVYNNKMHVASGGTLYCYNGTNWTITKTYDDVCAYLDMEVYNSKLYLATRDQAWRKPYYQGYSGFSGRVIEFDGYNWTTVFDHDYWIYSLETYGEKLYVGTANRIYTYNGTDWNISFISEEGAYYAISFVTFNNSIYVGMGNGYIFADPSFEMSAIDTITVPEFPSFFVLPLFMIATLIAVIVHRRKHTRQ